jgi:hypothetical protein
LNNTSGIEAVNERGKIKSPEKKKSDEVDTRVRIRFTETVTSSFTWKGPKILERVQVEFLGKLANLCLLFPKKC